MVIYLTSSPLAPLFSKIMKHQIVTPTSACRRFTAPQ